MSQDETLYRVTLICKCDNDYAEGYGPTPQHAHANAVKFFRKDPAHRRQHPAAEVLERAEVYDAQGSSRYVEVPIREQWQLAYRFVRSDGQQGGRANEAIFAKAMDARSAWVWWGRRHQDPLYQAATRRTYAMIDLHLERRVNGLE